MFSHYFPLNYWRRGGENNREEGDFTYGETPFYTSREILRWSDIKKEATVWDLGCGRGSFLFFASIYFGMRVVGIDVSPPFIRLGRLISRKLKLKNAEWVEGDFLKLDLEALPKPDLLYMASTTFSWQTILALAKKLESLPAGVKVVSLSAKLPSKAFKEIKKRDFLFSWGKATAHLHERVDSST